MPSKCSKVKNPCKICLETVTNKSGLQCQGACKKWVHFECLNYTPGKIKDIKQGIIKVTCPCPDCKTTAPKEYRTDEPFSCTNIQCPSNMPRSCVSTTCPSNQGNGPQPLRVCEKEACQKNKVSSRPPGCPIPPAPPSPSCPSSSSSGGCPPESPHVRGDMGSKPSAGPAMNVVEQICTTVGQLSNQINCLMNEMKNLLGGGSSNAPDDGCGHDKQKQQKPCNCPGNPRR